MRPCQNPVQIFGSPPLSPRLIKKEKRIALMSRFSFGLLNISTRCEGFFWTSLHFFQWHYRISSKYSFFQYLWEAVFSADAALSPLSLLASSWFSRSQTKMSAKSSSLSGLRQKRHCQIGWTGLYKNLVPHWRYHKRPRHTGAKVWS